MKTEITFDDDPREAIALDFCKSSPDLLLPIVENIVGTIRTGRKSKVMTQQLVSAVGCILGNVLYAFQIDPRLHLVVSRRSNDYSQTRYFKPAFGYRAFSRALELMIDDGLLEQTRGFHDRRGRKTTGRRTRVRASSQLLKWVGHFQIVEQKTREWHRRPLDHFAVGTREQAFKPHSKPAVPQGRLWRYISKAEPIRLKDQKGRLIPYADTEETKRMRDNLESWNRWLAADWHIGLLIPDDELKDVFARDATDDPFINFDEYRQTRLFLDRVHLHRVFNYGRFDRGGRFYGGWWQTIPSGYRRWITIQGYPIQELDFSNLHPAILYARKGLPLVADAYTIEGLDRGLVKTTFFKLLNALPNQRIAAPKTPLPDGWSWRDVRDAVLEKHKDISDCFNSGVGLELQRIDADICEAVMLAAKDHDQPVLPIHDGFLVLPGAVNLVHEIMTDTYRALFDRDITVDVDINVLLTASHDLGGADEEVIIIERRRSSPTYVNHVKEFLMEREVDEGWKERHRGHWLDLGLDHL